MSLRIIDEIYSELHNGEKPPYTNARGPFKHASFLGDMDAYFSKSSFDYELGSFKFKNYYNPPLIENFNYTLPPIVD